MRKCVNVSFFLSMLFVLAGCRSDLGVEPSSKEKWLLSRLESPLTGKSMSYKVRNYLVEEALLDEYEADPDRVLRKLNNLYTKAKDYRALLALVELSYAQGVNSSGLEALSYYLSSAVYASEALKGAEGSPLTKYSPHFLYVCRCYNYAVTEIVRILQQENLSLSVKHDIPILQGTIALDPAKSFLPYPFDDYKKFIVCGDYASYGFLTSSRSFGLGVPLMAIQKYKDGVHQVKLAKNVYRISNSTAPTTAIMRIKAETSRAYNGVLEFYNPYNQDFFEVNGKKIPLEIDMTTPLAYMVRKGPAYDGFMALANPKYMNVPEGLFLLQKYDKNKIPLVIVHGLMSRPRTWSQMINTLMNDKKIRTKYQIWLFAYPTGFPVLYSAHKLRAALLETQKLFDPEKNNPNFNNMVVMGHSMGGLLTRSLVQETGDKLLKMIFDKPVDEMKISQKEKNLLMNLLVFKPLPFIKRVIFLSAPHRGADMTHWASMKFAVKFINLPANFAGKLKRIGETVDLKGRLLKGNNKSIKELQGVDGLDPNNIVQRYMAEQPISVKYHSIIGNQEKAGVIGGTDGIVAYKSAHLNGAQSELVVKSGHNTQKAPAAIKEVRRILLKHLEE